MANYSIEMHFDTLPKTPNSLLRKGAYLCAQEASKWRNEIWLKHMSERPSEPLSKVTLTLTRKSSKEPDYDGLVSSFKYVVDGLVKAEFLKDDSLSVTGPWICKWEKVPRGTGGIEIKIEEI